MIYGWILPFSVESVFGKLLGLVRCSVKWADWIRYAAFSSDNRHFSARIEVYILGGIVDLGLSMGVLIFAIDGIDGLLIMWSMSFCGSGQLPYINLHAGYINLKFEVR